MSTSQNPGGRIVPVVERPDRDFTPHRRIKADPPALTAGRGDFDLDQQAINRGCADAELQRRQQRRSHYLETLAADPI
jgi:hypothetical protein